MIVYVMQGIPGAGKTHWVNAKAANHNGCAVVSADNYFKDSGYDRSKLGEAHGDCLRKYVQALQKKVPVVFVDNTNTKIEEIAPFMALANAYGYDAKIIRVVAPVQLAFQRGVHKVPLPIVKEHAERLSKFQKPGRWNLEQVRGDE